MTSDSTPDRESPSKLELIDRVSQLKEAIEHYTNAIQWSPELGYDREDGIDEANAIIADLFSKCI